MTESKDYDWLIVGLFVGFWLFLGLLKRFGNLAFSGDVTSKLALPATNTFIIFLSALFLFILLIVFNKYIKGDDVK